MTKIKDGLETLLPSIDQAAWGASSVIDYGVIKGGALTNNFSRATARATTSAYDKLTGITKLEIKPNTYSIQLPKDCSSQRLRDSLYNLFDMLVEDYTAHGACLPQASTTIKQYMDDCGVSDRKYVRKVMLEDLQTLRLVSINFKEKRRGKAVGGCLVLSIIKGYAVDHKGNVVVYFTEEAHNILKSYPVMPYPKQIRRIDSRKNPNGRALFRALLQHKRINAGRPVADVLSVQSLLDVTKLPQQIDVRAGGRHFTQQIVRPFERDLDALEELGILHWEYCHQKGIPLSEQELEHFSYDVFMSCNVKVTWNKYPDQTHLIEARQKQQLKHKQRTSRRKSSKHDDNDRSIEPSPASLQKHDHQGAGDAEQGSNPDNQIEAGF